MMIGGAVVNALAFTGGNYLFFMLGRTGEAEKERNATIWPLRAPTRSVRVPTQAPTAA